MNLRHAFMVVAGCVALVATGADVYVAADGVDDNAPGRGTESSPYATIPYALGRLGAASDGTIFIGEGSFVVNTNLTVTGAVKFIGEGRDKTFITRAGTSYGSKKLFVLQNPGALVADLAITNVYAQDVGNTSGCLVEFPNTTGAGAVSNLLVKGCTAGSAGAGYVIYIGTSASAEIVGCTFANNVIRDSGGSGVVYANNAAAALVENGVFYGNTGFSTGALRINKKATVRKCTVVDNWTNFTVPNSARGGAIYLEGIESRKTIFDHCVFYGNQAPFDPSPLAPDLYYSTINATLTNCFAGCAWNAELPAIGTNAARVAEADFTDWYGGDYRPHTNSRLILGDGSVIGAYAPSTATGPAYTPSGPAEITLAAGASIQDALFAAPDGQVINLSEGIYPVTGRIDVLKNVKLRGAGLDKTFLVRSGSSFNATRFLSLGHPGAEVSGLTLSNVLANANNQPGVLFIWCRGGTFTNARITKCSGGGSGSGAAIGLAGAASSLISHCIINDNRVQGASAESIVYLYGGTLANSLIVKNTYFTQGCLSIRGPANVWNCTVADNTCRNDSTSRICGGIYWTVDYGEATKSTVRNSLVARNTAEKDTSAGAPEWYRNGSTEKNFTNCFWSCAWGSGVPLVGAQAVAVANASVFVNAAGGDYHLDTGSAAFNGGAVFNGLSSSDLDGHARIQGSAPDIGCYEATVGEADCNFMVTPAAAFTNQVFTLTPTLIGGEGKSLTCHWTFHNHSAVEADVVRTTTADDPLELAFATAGWRTVTLRVYDGESLFAETAKDNVIHAAVPTVYLAPYDAAVAPAYPYATPGTAARTNLAFMVGDAIEGSTIRILDGRVDVGGPVNLTGCSVIGNGWDATILTNGAVPSGSAAQMFHLNQAGTLLDNLCISNVLTYFNAASLINVDAGGGTVSRVKVVGCRGGGASNGYIAGLYGPDSRVSRCWFVGNTVQENGSCGCLYAGNGSTVENTLVDGTRGLCIGGGIIASGAGTTIRNCTVARNIIGTTGIFRPTATATGLDYHSSGGEGPTVVNGVFALNEEPTIMGPGKSAWQSDSQAALAANSFNGAFGGGAAIIGAGSIAVDDGNPLLFRNALAGDFAITHQSPLHNAGVYDPSWMDGAADLAGNPRIDQYRRGAGLVDIGAYEAPYVPVATIMFIR